MKKITKQDVLNHMKSLGNMTARLNDGEWAVKPKGGDENSTYYTDDAKDAMDTATLMSKQYA